MSEEATRRPNAAGIIIAFTCFFSLAYAILRYHIVGPVPWDDFPLFILNKGFALSAFVLLVLNFSLGPIRNLGVYIPESWLNSRKALGMTGFLLVLIHVFMSMLLFRPAIFGKFFDADGSLTLFAGLSMLGGILAFVALWAYNLSFQTFLRDDKAFITFITSRRFLLWSMLLTLVHLFFMGYEGWLNPSAWHGGLAPISLVCFILFVLMYIVNLLGRK